MIQAVSTAYRVMPADDAKVSTADTSPCAHLPSAAPAAHRAAAGDGSDARADSPDRQCSGGEERPSVSENMVSAAAEAGPSSSCQTEIGGHGVGGGGLGGLGCCIGVRHDSVLGAANPWEAASAAGRASAPPMQDRGGAKVQPQQRQVPLRVDESTPEEAACGVRVIWVSVEARLQGVASKLLDVARCASNAAAAFCHSFLDIYKNTDIRVFYSGWSMTCQMRYQRS